MAAEVGEFLIAREVPDFDPGIYEKMRKYLLGRGVQENVLGDIRYPDSSDEMCVALLGLGELSTFFKHFELDLDINTANELGDYLEDTLPDKEAMLKTSFDKTVTLNALPAQTDPLAASPERLALYLGGYDRRIRAERRLIWQTIYEHYELDFSLAPALDPDYYGRLVLAQTHGLPPQPGQPQPVEELQRANTILQLAGRAINRDPQSFGILSAYQAEPIFMEITPADAA